MNDVEKDKTIDIKLDTVPLAFKNLQCHFVLYL